MEKERIRVLDTLLANKIAAGEVVERPSSVVKELVENSIDAKSSSITIEIIDGGKKTIRVVDDGIGIDNEDVELAFLRHATSKVTSEDDLNNILTLGFRGEALASIVSVSNLTITTKREYRDYGVRINFSGGQLISKSEIGCPRGTSILVEDLFLNTPARKKYLKSSNVEAANILNIVQSLALGNPNISFKMYNNGKLAFNTSGNGDVLSTAVYVLGKDISKDLYKVSSQKGLLSIEGLISSPQTSRGNRGYQYIYINSRLISSALISRAVEDAYKELITVGRYPIFVLNLVINPQYIDINIHPTKENIRLWDDMEVYDFVTESVKETLKAFRTVPEIDRSTIKSITEQSTGEQLAISRSSLSTNTGHIKASLEKVNVPNPLYKDKEQELEYNIINEKIRHTSLREDKHNDPQVKQPVNTEDFGNYSGKIQQDTPNTSTNVEIDDGGQEDYISQQAWEDNAQINHQNLKVIGQILNTYIIVESNESIYIIDQHAAHERLTYEKLLRQYNDKKVVSQRLLQPQVIELSPSEYVKVFQSIDFFKGLGFNIEEFGQNSYIVREVPHVLGKPYGKDFFVSIVNSLYNGQLDLSQNTKLKAIISMACKASVKANDNLDKTEIQWLIDNMFEADNPYNCPHGRPTTVKITKYQLEKMFKRVL
jgi:DNA mismatch repair protein MutL